MVMSTLSGDGVAEVLDRMVEMLESLEGGELENRKEG